MWERVQEFRSSGVQEFRSSGVQEFRSSGVQEFRSSGVQEFFLRGILLTVAIREIDEVPSISTLDSELATLALRSL
jgi:hypothetical protein